jgi:ankyrin repeat protein
MRVLDRLRGIAAILWLSCGVAACAPSAADMFPVGGSWFMYRHQSLPEAGWVPSDLYRDLNGRRVLVERDIEFNRYYATQDCLLYETGRGSSRHITHAACGDHAPLLIDSSDYHRWRMDPDGLRADGPPRVVGGIPVAATIPLDDIKAAAESDRAPRPVERDAPIDVNSRNSARWTPLMEALVPSGGSTREERHLVVQALIDRGADVNLQGDLGTTALMLAAARDDADFIKPLLDAGAAVNAQDKLGRTALMVAAESFRVEVEKARMLIAAGADLTIRDSDGRTAAERMSNSTNAELLALLSGKRSSSQAGQ